RHGVLVAEHAPKLLRKVRSERRENDGEGLEGASIDLLFRRLAAKEADELVDGAQGGVEAHATKPIGHLLDEDVLRHENAPRDETPFLEAPRHEPEDPI